MELKDFYKSLDSLRNECNNATNSKHCYAAGGDVRGRFPNGGGVRGTKRPATGAPAVVQAKPGKKAKLIPQPPDYTMQRHRLSCTHNVARNAARMKGTYRPSRQPDPDETLSDVEQEDFERFSGRKKVRTKKERDKFLRDKGSKIGELGRSMGLTVHDAPDLSLSSWQKHAAAAKNPGALHLATPNGGHLVTAWLNPPPKKGKPQTISIVDSLVDRKISGRQHEHDPRPRKTKKRIPADSPQEIVLDDLINSLQTGVPIDLKSGPFYGLKLHGFS